MANIDKSSLMTYRPLPEFVTISNSPIDGLGLYAKQDIPQGTELGMSHFNIGDVLCRTPLGAFYNHSETPNAVKVYRDSCFFLKTTTDIPAGNEITCSYTFYEVNRKNE
jgi:SET domain-containing protein